MAKQIAQNRGHTKAYDGRNFCRYSVYDNKTDKPLIIDGTADECAAVLKRSRNSFYCQLHSEPGYTDYCPMGPCTSETPSYGDAVRLMDDNELAKVFAFIVAETFGTVVGRPLPDAAVVQLEESYTEQLRSPYDGDMSKIYGPAPREEETKDD